MCRTRINSLMQGQASSVTQTAGDSTTVVFRLVTPWMHALLTLSIPERESTSTDRELASMALSKTGV